MARNGQAGRQFRVRGVGLRDHVLAGWTMGSRHIARSSSGAMSGSPTPLSSSARAQDALPRSAGGFSRRALLSGTAAAAGLLALPGRPARAQSGDPAIAMWQRINEHRSANGRPALPLDHQLSAVSQAWSEHQRDRGSIGHNANRRQQYAWPVAGDGEVVGSMVGFADPVQSARALVDAWMNSSGHRAILLGDYTDIGVGWAMNSSGRLYGTGNFIRSAVNAVGQEGLAQSRELIADGSAARAVLVRDDIAADALAASGLVDGNTPMLFTRANQPLPSILRDELDRVMADGGIVHLVGGALPSSIDQAIRDLGATPQRLMGSSRYETAAIVAREVARRRGAPWRVFLANGDAWADAVAAGAFAACYGQPVLLTPRGQLHPAAAQVIADLNPQDRVLVGGEGVLTREVREAAGGWRVSGGDRAGTAGRVLLDTWSVHPAAGTPVAVSPGWTGDGWGSALALSTFCARHEAPLVFAGDGVPAPVAQAMSEAGLGPSAPPTYRYAGNVPGGARAAFEQFAGR